MVECNYQNRTPVDEYRWESVGKLFLITHILSSRHLAFDLNHLSLTRLNRNQYEIAKCASREINDNNPSITAYNTTAVTNLPLNAIGIVPSYDCNMRCSYCYNNNIGKIKYLDPGIAFKAIEKLAQNTIESGQSLCKIFFHGGEIYYGKNYEITKKVVHYAKSLEDRMGVQINCYTPTNGSISEDQIKWSSRYISGIQISIDGSQKTHFKYRILKGSLQNR